jgi:hypothetical protein
VLASPERSENLRNAAVSSAKLVIKGRCAGGGRIFAGLVASQFGIPATELLPVDLSDHQVSMLITALEQILGCRRDTASNLATYVEAAAMCSTPRFGLSEMAEVARVSGQEGEVRRMLSNTINAKSWSDSLLVDALCACVAPDQVKVAAIEYDEVAPGPSSSSYAALSLNALGQDLVAALDWRRIALDSDSYDADLIAAVDALLCTLNAHTGGLRPGQRAPLVVLSPQLGGDAHVRSTVAKRVAEYGALVDPGYARVRTRLKVYDRRRPGVIVGTHFKGSPEEDGPALVLPVKQNRSPANEFVVELGMGQARRPAIVRPHLALDLVPKMQGDRLRQRARHLQEMLSNIHPPQMLHLLRLDAFSHLNAAVYRRHALLLSLLHAILTGRWRPIPPTDLRLA